MLVVNIIKTSSACHSVRLSVIDWMSYNDNHLLLLLMMLPW